MGSDKKIAPLNKWEQAYDCKIYSVWMVLFFLRKPTKILLAPSWHYRCEHQLPLRGGLKWLVMYSFKKLAKSFMACYTKNQMGILSNCLNQPFYI